MIDIDDAAALAREAHDSLMIDALTDGPEDDVTALPEKIVEMCDDAEWFADRLPEALFEHSDFDNDRLRKAFKAGVEGDSAEFGRVAIDLVLKYYGEG